MTCQGKGRGNVKNSILHDLYLGQVSPLERRTHKNPAYWECIKKADQEEKYLSGRMSLTDSQHFQEFKKQIYKAMSIDEVEIFKIGYKLGARMVMEVMEGKEAAEDE